MTPIAPTKDGDLNQYNLGGSSVHTPRIYFVNGIRVLPREHAITASFLSLLIERPVWGVYNKTAGQAIGSLVDVGQCLLDYFQNSTARLSSFLNKDKKLTIPDAEIPALLDKVMRNSIVWNKATAELFRQLVLHRNTPQMIIAHSQGNLITSNALFVVEDVLGAGALANIRVYSLASPAPAWPLGIRHTNGGGGRQENAFTNDLVALLRPHNMAAKVGLTTNVGDFRHDSNSGVVSVAPHDTNLIIETLNFLKSIRGDLGLPKNLTEGYLEQCREAAEKAFPEQKPPSITKSKHFKTRPHPGKM